LDEEAVEAEATLVNAPEQLVRSFRFCRRNLKNMRLLTSALTPSGLWLRESALPLWASRGFDPDRGAFEEQLDFSGAAVINAPRRLMVQARQIIVYAAAALSGDYPPVAVLVSRATRAMIRDYLCADGQPGWVFSVDRSGRVVEPKRDLYAHAFVISALAWAMRLDPDPAFETALSATELILEDDFADAENGGYWDSIPRVDSLRRQNPHMHLLEAFVALYETTKRDNVLERGKKLVELSLTRFLDPATGALREFYSNTWRVHPRPGEGSVEPGHLFEWAWLLRRFEAVTGQDQTVATTSLIDMAIRYGFGDSRDRVVDEIGENGEIRAESSRLWSHAEALKALTTEATRGNLVHSHAIEPICRRLSDVYCRKEFEGGWIDHVDKKDRTLSMMMPASTLYHVYFGITSVETWIRGP